MNTATIRFPFIVALIGVVLVVMFFLLKPFLIVLTLAMIFAVILSPLYKKILLHLGGREALSASVTLFIGVVGLAIPLTFLITQLFQEAVQVYASLSEGSFRQHVITSLMSEIGKLVGYFVPGAEVKISAFSYNVDDYLKKITLWIINNLGTALSSVSTFLLDILIFLISLYYCIKDGHIFKKILHEVSPLGRKYDEIIFSKVESAVNSIIRGNLFIAITQGIFAMIGFAIFGVPNSILWGSLAMVASFVPRVGTALIIIPAVLYLFVTNHSLPAVLLSLWGVGIVGIIDNILGPKFIGKELALHPLSILLSVLGGILFFGPAGIFLGPLMVTLLTSLVLVYIDLNKHTLSR